jgi:hypothetical protein
MILHVVSMLKRGFIVIAILLITPVILAQNVIAADGDGHWVLYGVERNHGGRDDVSTTWNDVSDTALAGKTSWKWNTMDCTQTIVSKFSWSGIPETIVPGQEYPLNVKLEQLNNNNCLSVGSWIKIYFGPPTDISKPMSGMNDGPEVIFGTGNGLVGEKTLPIYAGYYDERGYAIMVWCWMYQEWYIVQYRYKWIRGDMPPENTNPNGNAEPGDQTPSVILAPTWTVKESGPQGNYEGIWTRRPGTDTFDASWSGGSITDVIDITSIKGNKITLHRHGNGGDYTGTISSDGTSISGTASWYVSGEEWLASM